MRAEVMRGAGLDEGEFGVVRPVKQQAVVQNEVSQEFVGGVRDRRGVDDATVSAGVGNERVHLFALHVCGCVGRAFGCEPDAQSFRDSPDVEQHTAQEEDLEALAKRSLAARTLCHLGESTRAHDHINPDRSPWPGMLFHSSGPIDGGWGVIDFWESRADFDAHLESNIQPGIAASGVQMQGPPDIKEFEVHEIIHA